MADLSLQNRYWSQTADDLLVMLSISPILFLLFGTAISAFSSYDLFRFRRILKKMVFPGNSGKISSLGFAMEGPGLGECHVTPQCGSQ